jgi:iron complex transport system ATP-binding protein
MTRMTRMTHATQPATAGVRLAAAPVISANRVARSFGAKAVIVDVTTHVAPGEVVALVGPNGAGKSTLLALLSGDLAPTRGTASLHSQPVAAIAPLDLARMRAVLPQRSNPVFGFTAHEIVAMGRFPWNDSPRELAARVASTLDRLNISALAPRSVSSLSGGEQTLVSLARVLVQDTPIVFLDEPTTALDLGHQETVMATAATLANEGRAVVVVLHDLNLAARFAHRIVVLHRGRVAIDAPPARALDERLLSDVYATPIAVVDHPLFAGRPLVLNAPC